MTFQKAVLLGAVIGIVVAVVMLGAANAFGFLFGTWALYLWPSSIFLLGTGADGLSRSTAVIFLMSLLGNAILYGGGAGLLWAVLRVVR